ncbi:PTS fructose transporter subunit IIB [Oscillospiraceae bacterium MB08-C2-2]|nr:PTS fructose transporter subunit IIB [Oscillospiraceae bacterium MB08-C2-2]
MRIVGITACIAGIAHTYIAKEKLVNAAEELGHWVKIETQGTIGTEDELTADEIAQADVVIIAADIAISGKDRFKGKRLVEIPVSVVMKSPKALIQKIEAKVNE